MLDADDAFSRAHEEVVRLHEFIEGWFRGTVAHKTFDVEFADVLDPEFENIQPAGNIWTKSDIVTAIRGATGTNTNFRILIEEPRLLDVWPNLILFGYVEYQTGARRSETENRRRSTALFELGPNLRWRHLQETGLP